MRLTRAILILSFITEVSSFSSATSSRIRLSHPSQQGVRRLEIPSSSIHSSNTINRFYQSAVYSTSLSTDLSWKTCAQPRFDEFACSIVGPWTQSTPSDEDVAKTATTYEVEEVMRSCGGAIQGIKELPLSLLFQSFTDEDRTYHNRAECGFVFFDDGSYTAGPERWDLAVSDEQSDGASSIAKMMMTSIAFPNRRRVWLTAPLDETKITAHTCSGDGNIEQLLPPTVLELIRPSNTSTNQRNNDITAPFQQSLSSSQVPCITWKTIQRVRMPRLNQAWSLPRAKWEKASLIDEQVQNENNTTTEQHCQSVSLAGWAFVRANDQGIFSDVENDGIQVHMLSACSQTKIARSIVRCYGRSGLLRSVAFLDGFLAEE